MLCVPMDAAYVFFGELALMDYCILSTPSDTQLPHPDHSGRSSFQNLVHIQFSVTSYDSDMKK